MIRNAEDLIAKLKNRPYSAKVKNLYVGVAGDPRVFVVDDVTTPKDDKGNFTDVVLSVKEDPRVLHSSKEVKNILVTHKSLLSTIAYWGIYQEDVFACPRNLEQALKVAEIEIKKTFERMTDDCYVHTFPTQKDLQSYVHDLVFGIQEIKDWNLSQEEHDAGIDVDSPERPKFSCNTNFIDLDALTQNITRTLVKISREDI